MSEKIILFDGVCNLCNKSIQFILTHEKNMTLKFASLQSCFSKNILNENGFSHVNYKSIVYIENKNIFLKSKAIFKISTFLKFPYNKLSVFSFLPLIFTDFIYDLVAKNRYSIFGKTESCFIPSKELKNRFIE